MRQIAGPNGVLRGDWCVFRQATVGPICRQLFWKDVIGRELIANLVWNEF